MISEKIKDALLSLGERVSLRLQEIEALKKDDLPSLAKLLSQEALLTQDNAEREWLLFRAGELWLSLGEKEQAQSLLEKISHCPEWKHLALILLEQQALKDQDLARLAELYQQRAKISEKDTALALKLLSARLIAFQIQDQKRAEEILAQLAQEYPNQLSIILTRAQFYLELGDWKKLAEVYQQLVELGKTQNEKQLAISYGFRLAVLLEGRIRAPLSALEWYQKLSEEKEAIYALPGQVEILESLRQHKELKPALEQFLALVSEKEPLLRALLSFKLAQLCELSGEKEAELELLKKVVELDPDNLLAFFRLEAIARSQKNFELLAMALEGISNALSEVELKLNYLLELGYIYLEFLNQPEKCQEVLEQAEKIAPDSLGLIRLAEALFLQKQDWKRYFDYLSKELKLTEDPKELQALLILQGEALVYGLSDLTQAGEVYRQALEVAPSQFPLLRSLQWLFVRNKDFESAVRIILTMEKLVSPLENRAYYAWRRAALSELGLAKPELAVSALSDLIKLKPDSIYGLFGLIRILREKRAWENYLKAVERALTLGQASSDYDFFLYQFAWDLENVFNQSEKAQALWQKFLKQNPRSLFLIREQRWLCYRTKDWQTLFKLWENFANQIKDPVLLSAFLVRAGFFAESFLGEPGPARAIYERALQQISAPLIYPGLIELAYFQSDWESTSALLKDFARVLAKPFQAGYFWQSAIMLWEKSQPGFDRVYQELKQALEIDQTGLTGACLREFLRSQNNFSAWIENLEELISRWEESALLPIQLELAWVLDKKQGQKDQSIEQYLKILTTRNNYLPVIRELEFLGQELKHSRLLVQALAREIPLRTEPELQIFLYHWLAFLYEQEFKDLERAVSALRAIQKLAPNWLLALEELRRLYSQTKAYSELVNLINTELNLIEDKAQKLKLIQEQAQIYEQKLNDPNSAIKALLLAQELSPKDPGVLYQLERIYQALGRFGELVEVIERRISLAEEEREKAELEMRAGEIYEAKIKDPAKAVSYYEQAERLLPEQVPILKALERLYPGLNRHSDLIRVLEKLAQLTPNLNDQAEIINRIGKIYREKLNQVEPAIESHLRVLKMVPENLPALEALGGLFREKSDFVQLVKVMERIAELVKKSEPKRAKELYLEAGAIYQEKIKDEDKALRSYQRAHELDLEDLRPIQAERKIFEGRKDWKAVAGLLELEAKILSAPEDKKKVLAQIGKLWEEKLASEDQAMVFYQSALRLDSTYLPALKPLCQIYYKRQNFEQCEPLFIIWARSLAQESKEDQALILYRFGMVEEKLGKVDKALEYYQASSQIKPLYLEPLERLFAIYLARGEKRKAEGFGRELVSALEKIAEPKRLFNTLAQMGELEKELNNQESAIDYLEQALGIQPTHYPSLRFLVDLYKAKKNWNKALSSYDRLLRASADPNLIASALVEKGELLEKELNQLESALAHFKKAVEVKPDYLAGFRALARVLLAERRWKECAEVYQRIIGLEPDNKKKVEDYYQLGLIYRDGFNELGKARESFEQALALEKMHIPSMEAILSIYLKEKSWEKYLELSQRFIGLIPKDQEKKAVSLYYQRAQVYRDFLNDRSKAITEFQNVLKLDSEYLQARIELADLYAKSQESYPSAIREHHEILNREVFRLESYRKVGMLYELLERLDEAFCCYQVLALFKATNRDEAMFLEAHQAQVNRSSTKTLADDSNFRLLVAEEARGALLELIAEIGDYLAEFFPAQLDKFGANKTNKVPANSSSGVKKLVDELALNLGISGYDLYLVPAQTEPKIVATNPPSLLVNVEWLNRFKALEQRFILGRWLEHLKLRHALIINNPLPEVIKAVMLFVWLLVPEFKVPGLSPGELEKQAKPIKRAIPRKVRGQLEEKAKALVREGIPKDLTNWQRGIIATGYRAGMLLANDLSASLSAILKLDQRFKQVNFNELADPLPILEQSQEAKELVRFWTSEAMFTLRKRIGFSLFSA